MASVAPAVTELVQDAVEALPVAVTRGAVFFGPGVEFGNQGQALVAMFHRFGFELVQPCFHYFVRCVAGLVKAFPQGMVGHATLVGLLPLLAHGAQCFLHLAPANGLSLRALEQTFGFDQQLFAQLVGTPALPAFQLARSGQGGLGLIFEFVVNDFAKFFECLAHGIGSARAGLAMAFAGFFF